MKKKLQTLNEKVVDLFFVFMFLKRLVTPFKNWKAYKLGIIDDDGKIIKKKTERRTQQEKDALTKFDLMVLKLKRLLGKLPFGKTTLASYAAALWFIKEGANLPEDSSLQLIQDSYLEFYNTVKSNPVFVKEIYQLQSINENIEQTKITKSEAKKLGDQLKVDFTKLDLEEFRKGVEIELEHDDDVDPKLDVIDSLLDAAKIALAHLKENPNYYSELEKSGIEEEIPANAMGGGNIATYDPVIKFKTKKKKKLKSFKKFVA